MKISFAELKNVLFESGGGSSMSLLLEAGQDANAIGATITEVFPCIYWYFNVKQGLTVDDVLSASSASDQMSFVGSMAGADKNPSNEIPIVPNGFLKDRRTNAENPFKFKNGRIDSADDFYQYLNDSIQELFSKGGRNALAEKLQQANAIYRKLKAWCGGRNVKGVYWTADKAGKAEGLIDLHSEADICVEYLSRLGAVSYYSISIKADANAFNQSNTLKASNRSLRTWFLPIDATGKLMEPIIKAVNDKLVYNGFSKARPSGWSLRGDEGLDSISDNYTKIRQLIVNKGLGGAVSHLSTVRSDLEDAFVTSFVEVMKSLDPRLFKKVIRNSLGYGAGLHVWKANNNQCVDITKHVKLFASEIDNVDEFTVEAVQSQTPKTSIKNPASSTTPNVIFKWTNDGKEYKLGAQIRLADSFAKARKSKGDSDPSTSVLNKTLDKFIMSDIGKSNRMRLAYDQGFFKSVLFAIFFKPVETWKIMTILPGSNSVVNESYDDFQPVDKLSFSQLKKILSSC